MTNQMSKWTRELLGLQDSITHLNENMEQDNPAWLAEIQSLQKKRGALRDEMVHAWGDLIANQNRMRRLAKEAISALGKI